MKEVYGTQQDYDYGHKPKNNCFFQKARAIVKWAAS